MDRRTLGGGEGEEEGADCVLEEGLGGAVYGGDADAEEFVVVFVGGGRRSRGRVGEV